MIGLGEHWEFIVAAYVGAIVVVGAVIGWTAYDARRTWARIAALEAASARRRGQ